MAAAIAEARRAQASKAAFEQSPKYRFYGGNARLIDYDAQEVILSGPSETGKTLAALSRMHGLAGRYPGMQGVIVRKVRSSMDGTVLKTWEEKILGLHTPVAVFGGERPEWYDYPNRSRVWVSGLDKPSKVLSGEKDAIFVNQAEELTLEDWEILLTRVTGRAGHMPFGQLFGDCNPGPPHHWIKNRPNLELFESRHEDNPTLFDPATGEITERGQRTLLVLDSLTGVRKERLRLGRWVSAEGTVYEFDAAVHLIDPFEIPPEWRRIRSIDFGYSNPFVCGWWAIDPDGRAIKYREIYMSQRTVKVHAEQIKRLSGNERYEATIADHDAEDRATLEENGIVSIPARKEITVGIQAVQERLQKAGDGKPRLFIMRGCLVERDERLAAMRQPVSTEQEFDVYSWPKSAEGKPVKEVPVDLFNHGMDETRYAVMYVDNPTAHLPKSQPTQRSRFLIDPAPEGSRWKNY